MQTPDAGTRLVGVVGHPIGHTLSPAFWNAAFEHEGRNAVFLAFDVEPASFERFIEGMAAAGARGFSVTMPHKRAAFELASVRSVEAERTGAVNVLVLDDRVVGANTDVHGVRLAVHDLGIDVDGASVLVVGAGGAASAAVWALTEAGASVTVVNRTRERAESLASSFGSGVQVAGWDELEASAAVADLLVHAASIGMDGVSRAFEDSVLATAAAGRLRAVLDVVYAPDETALVHAARAAGLRAADGLGMLVHQAEQAYRLFWDAPAPTDVMHDAARRAAGRRRQASGTT
jgi:shikimate dehydrogenase